MGVNEQLIIMIGCKLEQDAYDYDKHEEYDIDTDGKPNIGRMSIIHDGMSGKYLLVGIPLYVSDRYDCIEGLDMFKLDLINPKQEIEIKEFIRDKFGINKLEITNYVFMHYT